MRTWAVAALAAATMLAGCGPKPPVKRQPGSWSQKVEITRFEGKQADPRIRQGMQQMFDAMSGMRVCLTPDFVAREDISKRMAQLSGQGSACTPDKTASAGSTIAFAATCKQAGSTVRMAANGTTDGASQDFTIKIESTDAAGASEGIMEMHVTSKREGECTPGELTPPANAT